ncbi:Uncharacterised protein [Escherichia coli]|nr:Uncharacterised protein [Escherichia coli]
MLRAPLLTVEEHREFSLMVMLGKQYLTTVAEKMFQMVVYPIMP